ncbi:MAG: polysaccharide pyruvyl transferase family protein [Clostridia bacterium]|nr:polysaccharide pyruvyl transferase family protein [Clostridia bacterium]
MKIGILTLNQSYSYGACLQAYATFYALQEMGHEVEFINYVNEEEQSQNHLFSNRSDWSMLKNAKASLLNILFLRVHNSKKAFDSFHTEFLEKKRRTLTKEELQDLQYDVLLSGSDQLWNPTIFSKLDTAYFLDFGTAKKRISYAASAGSHCFSENEIHILKPLLEQYDAISVREKQLKHQLEDSFSLKSEVVIDPTFLLTAEEWLNIDFRRNFKAKGRYILLYMIGVPFSEYKERYAPLVEYVKRKLNLPVYVVGNSSFLHVPGGDRNLTGMTPIGLVHAIHQADLVLTSSFHGVAFSINLNRPFIALENSNPDRVNNLLTLCGLENRKLSGLDKDACEALLRPYGYMYANEQLKQHREASKAWVQEQLKG